ncbi:hypothetical protein CEUSTIGMA_g5988.t1 [Chlamydomonas eustigma]|uniref:BHLH domain-containing protein n=1 Tax=Chlamydomonas eustigma TaxID=1157962 RepID=A0A250X645_9CHLO|nr:hypothetical protein CEUSTIGMA_g5988.t1 [Chlamydomonas eustigma]|eukprot:GAX78548.1 hypothetical protein CEUSTIGMA_g5988.t1 [Chlamydomonas eustigma]
MSSFDQLVSMSNILEADDLNRQNVMGSSFSGPSSGKIQASRSTSSHASRHQAAEQRRRTRINERLDMLRKMVPHTERSNTAVFLEELINYINLLKMRMSELESTVQSLKSGRTIPASHLALTHLDNTSASQQQHQLPAANAIRALGGCVSGLPQTSEMKPLSREHLSTLLQQAAAPQEAARLPQLDTHGFPLQQLQLQQLQLQQQRQQIQQLQLQAQAQEVQLKLQQDAVLQATLRGASEQQSRPSNSLAELAERLGLKTLNLDQSSRLSHNYYTHHQQQQLLDGFHGGGMEGLLDFHRQAGSCGGGGGLSFNSRTFAPIAPSSWSGAQTDSFSMPPVLQLSSSAAAANASLPDSSFSASGAPLAPLGALAVAASDAARAFKEAEMVGGAAGSSPTASLDVCGMQSKKQKFA